MLSLTRCRVTSFFFLSVAISTSADSVAALEANETTSETCRILLTNDDGIYAPGIKALYQELSQDCDVTIVAPDTNSSGASQSIKNVFSGISVSEVHIGDDIKGYAVAGTPVEAVDIGLMVFGKEQPFDLVVSGLNDGDNVGLAHHYSGTVNAAMEALLYGVPAIAISQSSDYDADFSYTSKLARGMVNNLWGQDIPHGTLLNINIPIGPLKGITVVKSADSTYAFDRFDVEEDGNDRVTYTPKYAVTTTTEADGDTQAYLSGMITITPLRVDHTNYQTMGDVEKLDLGAGLTLD